jgi:hypothetical protein
MATGAGEILGSSPSCGKGAGDISWTGATTVLRSRAAGCLLSRAGTTGRTSRSLIAAVMPRIPPQASTKQAATAALAVRVLAGGGMSVSRRWLVALVALRRRGSAPIHAISAVAGGPEPALRR